MENKKIIWLEEDRCRSLIDFEMAAGFLGCKKNLLPDDMLEELQETADLMVANMKPRYMFQVVELLRGQEGLFANFPKGKLLLPGKSICEHLGTEKTAVAACLTIGDGADKVIEMLQQDSMLKAILADALANAAVELLRAKLEKDAAKTLGWKVGWLFGIGYGDLPLGLQKDFLDCMDAQKIIRLAATEKMILSPSKSVTGFLNVQNREEKTKEGCNGRCSICPNRERCRIFGSEH